MSVSPKRRVFRINVTHLPPAPTNACEAFMRPVVITEEQKLNPPTLPHPTYIEFVQISPPKPPPPSFKRAWKLRMQRMLRLSNSKRRPVQHPPSIPASMLIDTEPGLELDEVPGAFYIGLPFPGIREQASIEYAPIYGRHPHDCLCFECE